MPLLRFDQRHQLSFGRDVGSDREGRDLPGMPFLGQDLLPGENPSLDPIADDVGSLGLDILMKDTEFRRGGFNPYLAGY